MAYVGISGDACPSCISTATTEISNPTNYPEREVVLQCYECGKRTSYGVYKPVGGTLVKIR